MGEFTCFVLHMPVVLRPGILFVQRLLAHINMSLSSPVGVLSSIKRCWRLVPFSPGFHGDFKFWRSIVEAGIHASEGGLSAPMYRLIARLSCRTLISDAFKHAVGVCCLETGQHWR